MVDRIPDVPPGPWPGPSSDRRPPVRSLSGAVPVLETIVAWLVRDPRWSG